MIYDFFEKNIEYFKDNYSYYKSCQNFEIFTVLCIKYYFYNISNISFDPEIAMEYLTDGARDGGIDAILNDPNSEGNDMIIVQSKYYDKTKLDAGDIVAEISKINDTLNNLKNNKVTEYSEKLVSAYYSAVNQMEDQGEVRIYFFTTYQPKNSKERNKIDRLLRKDSSLLNLEINFGSDIEAQIDLCNSGRLYVDYDKLCLDRKDNYLLYEDSVIVNISAQSLQDLYNRRRNGLLGMNLRFYIRQKVVDDGIDRTIKAEAKNFWYKNNGILIMCDDYNIDGKELKLFNFSIVNGGQTTNRIGRIDIEDDFYLQCKVVKIKGKTLGERDTFTNSIAEATNAQKPIKKSDLKSNTPEQLRLKERLKYNHVYYITKKGEKAPKQYGESYQVTTLEQVGKLSLAAVLQMPGSSRNNSQRMYNDEYYYSIFGLEAKEGVIADLLKIAYYYEKYLKNEIKNKGYDEKTVLPMIKNGRTFQYACITLLCKINQNVFTYSDIIVSMNYIDELKLKLRKMGEMKKIIYNKMDKEQDIFFQIFTIIGEEVLGYCFGNAIEKAESEQRTLAPSDYLKSDTNYYKDVIKRLWSRYNQNLTLKNCIDLICGK